ncbi:asparagine synthase (glutamine-hydrolysing) [Sinosporangium album]|uniref:asparagine synthase (glutamine-hydrolyzing) n=1 Tax=Sinosporangium album TaxID=504805 RepID=A0A1G8C7Y6_9ACTN|nr:asparagine synthase-related protein [Sinosporangium album]SDH41631.1 asparagine synthase (glutamine-hydrolysing) [Sinosporangium album]
MSGIAGWVDFHRDLSVERGAVLSQLATLAARGPGAENVWIGRHALLGSRGGPRGSGQAIVAAQGDSAVVVMDGHLTNAASLHAELSGYGRAVGCPGYPELVGHAYLQWGEACAEHLEGMFAAAVWHPRHQRLTLLRDRLGTRPLYYQRTADGLLFGSEPKAVLIHPLADTVVNAGGLRELFAYTSTPGAGIVRSLRRVLPGGRVDFDRSGMRECRYWQVAAEPHHDGLHRTVRKVRELLEASVENQIGGDPSVGLLLSGGLDSSAVAALAAAVLRRRNAGRLRTFTTGYADVGPAIPGPIRGPEDRPHAAVVARHLRTEHHYLPLDTAALTDVVTRSSAVSAQQDTPVAMPQFPASLRMLCRHVSRHTNAALGGHRADIVFGSNDEVVFGSNEGPDGTERGDRGDGGGRSRACTYPWISAMRMRYPAPAFGTGLFSQELLGRLDIPTYCADMCRTDLASVPRLPGEDVHDRRMREISFLRLQGLQELDNMLDDGASSFEGVDLRLPFSDHRLVQYLFNVPWALKCFDGRSKSLLRAATADLLPDSVLERAPSHFPIGRHPAYGVFLRRQLAHVLADRGSPVVPLLDVAAARRLIKEPIIASRTWVDVTDMEMVLQVNQWLERFNVRVLL